MSNLVCNKCGEPSNAITEDEDGMTLWCEPCLVAAKLAIAPAVVLNDLLGPKHTGMKISGAGLLGRIADGWKIDKGMRYQTGVMLKHLEETGKRFCRYLF